MHPFEIFFDKDSQKYYMFLPDGSVMVDGINCECDERGDDLNVALDLDPENLPEKLYGHVTVEDRKVKFDGKEPEDVEYDGSDSDDKIKRFDFVVCSFGKEENDGLQYDVCTSAINFSTSGQSGSDGGFGKYEGDEHSVSLAASGDTAKNNRFKIFGFGTDGHRIDATSLEIGEDASEEEFIVRSKDADGKEFVGYRKIKVGSASGRTPFEYQKIPNRNEDFEVIDGFSRKIVFNKFYFDGRFIQELGDYTIVGNPSTVWLQCSKVNEEASDSDTGEEGQKESWRFEIVEDQPKEDEFTVSVRLYDFNANGDVEVDYRTTFLTLNPKVKKEEKDEWANPKSTIAYGGEEDEAPSVSLTVEDELSEGTSEDGGVAEEQKPTGKKQLKLDIKLEKPVLTLNDLNDAIEIEGGDNISVTVEGQKIKISYDEKKPEEGEKEEEDRKNPCDHDSSGNVGGVNPDDEPDPSGGVTSVVGVGYGGVPAGGEPHVGGDDCNCE